MATAAPPKKSVYLYRLLTLTIDQGNTVVRTIVDQAIFNVPFHKFLAQEKKAIKRLRANKVITKVQFDLLFPKSGPPPTTADLDLTLLVCLLRNLKTCGLNPNFNWSAPPQTGDVSREADIRRLQYFRNELAHISSTCGLNQAEFNNKWSETEQVLNRLNGPLQKPVPCLQKDIDYCKDKPLDPEAQEHIEKHIDNMQSLLKYVNTEVQAMQKDVDDVKTTLGELYERTDALEKQKKEEEISEPDAKRLKIQLEEDIYQQTKTKLKEDLITLYRQQYHTLPLSPLFEENDTPLLDFYVMPDINKVEIQRSLGGGKEKKSKLKSFHELFYKENELCRDIYLLADAGLGKTAFSKRLVLTWCQAHKCIGNEKECFEKTQTDVMSQFEFVFLLSLRECSRECDIDEMIRKHIVPRLAYTHENIENFLSKEKCLVILDGLDEWVHPTSQCPVKPRDIPHRKAREKCPVITTTRPWRLSVINLDSTKINKKLELEGLNEKSRDTLKKNVISQYMSGATEEQVRENIGKFDSEVANKGISDLETIPLLLLYLLCLWLDDIDLGKSKCEIYCQVVELLLKRALSKHPELQSTHGSWLSKIPSWLTVFNKKLWAYLTFFFQAERPQCFREQKHCKEHFTFLTSLGELAFERLFSETIDNRLVFDSSIAEKYLKEDFLELGRFTGIITQDKQRKLKSPVLKTSYSHKTVQEFFAALYISTCSDKDKSLTKVISICVSIQDILDLSKVFIFISGMNAELFSLLSNELIKVINKDERTSKYRSSTESGYEHPLKDIQEMFVSCFKEIPDNKDVAICLKDLFFDEKCDQDNYYTRLQRLALQNKTNITSIFIFLRGCRSLTEIIDDCELSDPQIQCQKLYCWCICKEEDIFRLLSTSVKCLYIFGIRRDNECKDARSSLTDEQCKTFHISSQLETIRIRNFTVSHKFLNYIINAQSIKQITLEGVSCNEHVSSSSEHESSRSKHELSCPGFNFELSQHPELKKLVLTSGNFTFCDMNNDASSLLHKMRNIKHVELYKVKMSSSSLRRFVEIIVKLEHSVRVELVRCETTPSGEFEDIKDYIRNLESYKVEKDGRERHWTGRDVDVFKFVTNK